MCIVCLGAIAAGTAAVAVDKRYNDSRVTNYIKVKISNKKR